jgi:SH3-like domain-containing protein
MSSPRIVLIGALLLASALAFGQAAKQMSVQVKTTQIRATPSFVGKILGTLSYGDRVTVLAQQSGWARISLPAGKGEGWVNLSALSPKRIVLKAGSQEVASGASSGEVALAGKGFNREVEAEYRDEKQLDYTWIDRMEAFRVSPEQVLAFLQQGGLPTSLGGTP